MSVSGKDVVVNLGTDASSAISSTALQVVDALNGDTAASALLTAATYRGNAGAGLVAAAVATKLTDNLKAPATSLARSVPDEGAAHRQAARRVEDRCVPLLPGARPRMGDPADLPGDRRTAAAQLRPSTRTRKLVDDLDIFILPTSNPDGGHYSDVRLQHAAQT
ncbi:hypothetical protein GCM10018952_62870 [Streptosporangium vulgare]